jgi:hypothetical protein
MNRFIKPFYFQRLLKPVVVSVMLGWLCAQCASGPDESKRLTIPGTMVSMIPAEGFQLTPEIAGFKNYVKIASIIVMEIPQQYQTIVSGITKENIARQKTTLLDKEEVEVAGKKGLLYKITRLDKGINFNQWVLVLPVEKHTLTVNGTYLKQNEKDLSETIREAMLTTRIQPAAKLTDALRFAIEPDSLKFARILGGPSVMYTRSGAWTDSAIFDLSFFAGPSTETDILEPTQEFAEQQLKEICADCVLEETDIQPVTIDNLKGFELVSASRDSTTHAFKRLKYEVILYDTTRYYLMVGTSSRESDAHVQMFKGISRSFRRKV